MAPIPKGRDTASLLETEQWEGALARIKDTGRKQESETTGWPGAHMAAQG